MIIPTYAFSVWCWLSMAEMTYLSESNKLSPVKRHKRASESCWRKAKIVPSKAKRICHRRSAIVFAINTLKCRATQKRRIFSSYFFHYSIALSRQRKENWLSDERKILRSSHNHTVNENESLYAALVKESEREPNPRAWWECTRKLNQLCCEKKHFKYTPGYIVLSRFSILHNSCSLTNRIQSFQSSTHKKHDFFLSIFFYIFFSFHFCSLFCLFISYFVILIRFLMLFPLELNYFAVLAIAFTSLVDQKKLPQWFCIFFTFFYSD